MEDVIEKDEPMQGTADPPVIPAAESAVAVEEVPTIETEEVNPGGTFEYKDKVIALLGSKNPGFNGADEAGLWKAIYTLLNQLTTFQDRLYEVIEEFPEFGEAVDGMLAGMDPGEAIARYFDVENLTPPEGAPDFEKIGAAKGERRKRLEGVASRKKQLLENEQVSIENVKKMMQNRGWDQAKTMEFLEKIKTLQADLFDGKLTEEHLDVLEKGFAFDSAIAEKDKEIEAVAEDARIAGRNEQMMKKRAGRETGDGLPRLSNTGSAGKKKEPIVSVTDNQLPSKKLNFK